MSNEYADKLECPVCKGEGTLDKPRQLGVYERRRAAAVLLEQGFGIREVTRLLGYKSPQSVWQIKKKFVDVDNNWPYDTLTNYTPGDEVTEVSHE